tara:strand:- start:1981 stop:2241 length:261 start_codon:yes stop_codon:yes gene_type:complete
MSSASDRQSQRAIRKEQTDDHYEVDVVYARNILGWKPTRSLRLTLPGMIGLFHADREGWYEEHNLKIPEATEFRNWKATGQPATPF